MNLRFVPPNATIALIGSLRLMKSIQTQILKVLNILTPFNLSESSNLSVK